MRWDDVRYRPIEVWPGDPTPSWQRRRSQFSAPWGRTVQLLERELEYLGAKSVVLQVALTERDIRIDGRPRAKARAEHPGVILAFDSAYGPLQYATDVFDSWQDNIRAIALSLESLRAVNRYGVSRHGEQYRGWKQLPQSSDAAARILTRDEAYAVIHSQVSDLYGPDDVAGAFSADAIKEAIRRTHPDRGGDAEQFRKVIRARELIET